MALQEIRKEPEVNSAGSDYAAALLASDPGVRATYSNDPSFVDGAQVPNPIDARSSMLLAADGVAQALEHIYLMRNPGAQQVTGDPELYDPRLKEKGLRHVRQNSNSAPMLHRLVVGIQKSEKAVSAHTIEPESPVFKVNQALGELANSPKKTRIDTQPISARLRQDLEDDPDFNEPTLNNVLELVGNLRIFDQDGQIVIGQKPGYALKIKEQASEMVNDPHYFGHFYALMHHISKGAIDYGALQPASEQIFRDIVDHMTDRCGTLNIDTILQWHSTIVNLPDTIAYDELSGSLKHNGPQNVLSDETEAHINFTKISAAVVENSLVLIAEHTTEPEPIIESIHAIGFNGISSGKPASTAQTIEIIHNTLARNDVANIVMRSAPLSAKLNETQAQNALDIIMAMQYFKRPLDPIDKNTKIKIPMPETESYCRLNANIVGKSGTKMLIAKRLHGIAFRNDTIIGRVSRKKYSKRSLFLTPRSVITSLLQLIPRDQA